MKVSTDSWHYRLVRNVSGEPNENLCPYFWQVMLSILLVVALVSAIVLFGWLAYDTTGDMPSLVFGASVGALYSLMLSTMMASKADEGTWLHQQWQRVERRVLAWRDKYCTELPEDWSPPGRVRAWLYRNFKKRDAETGCDYWVSVASGVFTILATVFAFVALPIFGLVTGEYLFGFAFYLLVLALAGISAVFTGVQALRGKLRGNLFYERAKAAKNKVCPRIEFTQE